MTEDLDDLMCPNSAAGRPEHPPRKGLHLGRRVRVCVWR